MHHREPQFFPPIFSSYFFPYADALSLSAHTMKRHGMPAKRHKIARLYAPKNAPLQFKSGCHLHMNEARFSNIFIEKRASSCPQSLEKSRLFSYPLLMSEGENSQNVKRIFLRKVVI